MTRAAETLDQIVRDGVCIGCGLCAAISDGRVEMHFTPEQRERPISRSPLSATAMESVRATCPGLVAAGIDAAEAGPGAKGDRMWGYWHRAFIGWATDPGIRYRASTGGALSALSSHLLVSGEVDFILHLGPDPDRPARSRWKISRTVAEAVETGGSRYGPSAPLAGLAAARAEIERGARRFAFIGKPCDVSAIRLLARREPWLEAGLAYRLTFMCGGVSEFSKTADLLTGWGVAEEELVELRYRGNGNPGPTAAQASDRRRFAVTYNALWEDENTWALQHRCKICPDAIGMASDLVAFDCWPGGGPTGEDEGFNAIMTRTPAGERLLDAAVAAGALTLGRPIDAEDIESFQPHQSRKRRAVWARLAGQRAAGRLAPEPSGLAIEELARANPWRANLAQARGTARRLREGRGTEPDPVAGEI